MTTINIKGMSCQHCVMAVQKALNGIEGIQDVVVDLAANQATFETVQPVDMEVVKERIKKAGFEVV